MEFKERVVKARNEKGFSQSALGKKIGVTREAVSQWESGDSEPTAERLRKIAIETDVNYEWLATNRGPMRSKIVAGLELLGTIAAGVWAEVVENQDAKVESVPVAPDPRYPREAQYALRVTGTSVDKVAADGAILACVDIYEAGIDVRDGDLVCVERRRGSLIETTVKRVKKNNKNIELWPESNDPAHQQKIQVAGKDAEVTIKALVIGVFNPIQRGA